LILRGAFQHSLYFLNLVVFEVLLPKAFFLGTAGGSEGGVQRGFARTIDVGVLLSMVREESLSVSPSKGIVVGLLGASHLQVPFEPLDHLQVVLVLGFGQLVDVDLLGAAQLLQSLLVQLEVAHELVLELCVPVDLAHWHCLFVEGIDQLAVDRP
jgi:hypothetical protein